MRNAARLVTLSLCFALAGCPDRNPPVDGGSDAGRDAPTIDARADVPIPGDTGPVDGGTDDGGMSDGGTDDGGTDDAGGPFCGDGVTNGDEDCDLSDLGLNTCETESFDTGTLACADDCTFDTAACRDFSCGDAMIEGAEVCDGTNLGKNTCGSAGFDGGTVTCAADCTLNTSACTDCGDGMIEGTETCDGANLGGATCVSLGFISGALTCGATCGYDTSTCMAAPAPTAGQIVITEIMPDPRTISDANGEWFEVRNTSAGVLQLQNCVFSDNQATPSTFTVTSSLLIPAGGYATFGRTALVGFTPTYIYGNWNLANTAPDQIMLTCGTTMIDQVTYTTPAVWHFGDGIATSLNPSMTTAAANDSATNWCAATAQYEATGPNFGTPGAANPTCVVTVPELCTGGLDEDGDTFIDCLDTDCAASPSCVVTTPEVCTGGLDEDGDTFIDCLDSDCAGNAACGTPPALLFSEYVEGSSFNKALELLNTGTTPIDLAAANCSLRVYTNATGLSVPLTGTIAPGDVFVVCHTSASFVATCDQSSGNMSFNGDDAIVLTCGTTVVDSFGDRDLTPRMEWGTGLTSTEDNTLRRLCTRTPDISPDDDFDPSLAWSGFASNTVDGLGSPACVTP